ncbi:Rieske 2Fe-2S domain-containing protein [Fulvivirga sediminis]|uniref:Rieske 2Fe-2S domain-containing protein n=1 Tax=Fulvivirga sediminis TaxID=2803949 RepID=A0A937JWT5_9BACT|nr:Rieske 2Fe-2S domain-containing protein [Fulvivirga sediminis]MBL3654848.1 Rieske 2Fe-2S domain-containing protein [Fulvivirga sediminis]
MNRYFLFIAVFSFGLFSGCGEESYQDEMPYTGFPDVYMNLDLPQYNSLSFDGGFYLLDKGVRGIIVYRSSGSEFHAYEQNCPYHPYEACATVSVHNSGLYIFCPCCQSQFSFDSGNPIGGPSQYPLREYVTHLTLRSLTVTDEIL